MNEGQKSLLHWQVLQILQVFRKVKEMNLLTVGLGAGSPGTILISTAIGVHYSKTEKIFSVVHALQKKSPECY